MSCTPVDAPPDVPPPELWPAEGFDGDVLVLPPEQAIAPAAIHAAAINEIFVAPSLIAVAPKGKNRTMTQSAYGVQTRARAASDRNDSGHTVTNLTSQEFFSI